MKLYGAISSVTTEIFCPSAGAIAAAKAAMMISRPMKYLCIFHLYVGFTHPTRVDVLDALKFYEYIGSSDRTK